MKYIKINNEMFLSALEVQKDVTKKVKDQINHIWIYDRSGSMSGSLGGLAKDLIARAKQIPVGDTISIAWFSGIGEHNFVLKGFKISDNKDYKVLENAINANSTPVGMTCFSEILEDTAQVVTDLLAITDKFALCFLTDGYPTVGSYQTEVNKVRSAINAIKGEITSSLLIGYGNYYNKQLMSDMAGWFGGALCHSEDLPHFSVNLESFINDSRGSTRNRVDIPDEIDTSSKVGFGFSINKKQISIYDVWNSSGYIDFSFSEAKKDYIYFLTDIKPENCTEEAFTDTNVKGDSKSVEHLVKAAYAAAYILTQQTKTDKALEVLSALGDVELINKVNNAFTNADYGKAEDSIKLSMSSPSKRFSLGRDTKFLPKADAFCVLDVLDLLMEDKEAKFLPYHDHFEYKKITSGAKSKSDYPDFEGNEDQTCPLAGLSWNQTKLNLSMLTKIQGVIELKDGCEKLGFSKKYPTSVFRNYAIVKDGFLNIRRLPVVLSYQTAESLKPHDILSIEKTQGSLIFATIELHKLPVINRSIANGKTSCKDLCTKMFEEAKLEAHMKVLKYLLPSTPSTGACYNAEQTAFLESHGINSKTGVFSPPSTKNTPTDFYMAKEFEIKIKGFSTLPKVSDIQDKVKSGATLTGPSELMGEMIKWWDGLKQKESVKQTLLADKIKEVSTNLGALRKEIQRTKFAIILGKKWFDEFTTRENNVLKLKLDGTEREFTVSLREVKVDC